MRKAIDILEPIIKEFGKKHDVKVYMLREILSALYEDIEERIPKCCHDCGETFKDLEYRIASLERRADGYECLHCSNYEYGGTGVKGKSIPNVGSGEIGITHPKVMLIPEKKYNPILDCGT